VSSSEYRFDKESLEYAKNSLGRCSAEERPALERKIQESQQKIDEIDANIKEAEDRYHHSVNSAVCPICGAKLQQEKGYFLPDYFIFLAKNKHLDYDERVSHMMSMYGVELNRIDTASQLETIRKNIESGQITASVEEYVQTCDIFVAGNTSPKITEIKRNIDSLKTYILNLIRLENNIYSLRQRLTELYHRRLENDRVVVHDTFIPTYQIKVELKELRNAYLTALEAVSNAETYQPDVSINYPDEPSTPVLGTPGLFNKKKVLAKNEVLMKQYQTAMDAYRNEVRRCDEEKARLIVMERNAVMEDARRKASSAKMVLDSATSDLDDKITALINRPIPAKAVKKLLDQEIAETEELLKKSYAARNELYAYEIIFGKYRNTVALSPFYEYLMSGRCVALEGTDGAYNIYESEIRADRVITQLDTVISSLEDIKENQYMMYQEMRTTNSLLSRLNSTMDRALTSIQGIEANTTHMNEYMERIAENSDVIAHNTAVTAFYSKVNAELTNALGYMVAFK
jgi:hypothetical protein